MRLLDLTALVMSYSFAALLARAFWPHEGPSSRWAWGFFAVAYLWLGLAMGGPIVLLLDRRGRSDDDRETSRSRYSWAETAWLLIGGYWIGLAMLVVPSRLPVNPLLGVFPIFGAIAIRVFSRSRPVEPEAGRSWTHPTAVLLLVTWPAAWLAMIALGHSLN